MAGGLLFADAIGPGLLGGPQWGIFSSSGAPLIVADSVDDVAYSRKYQLSSYPQEQGAFANYNKVKTNYNAPVSFNSNQTRVALLNSLEALAASLQLVSVVMPEIVYPSGNIIGYDVQPRTSDKGVTFVRVKVWVEEVRIVAAGTTTSGTGANSPLASTNGATPTQSGNVQTIPAGNQTFAASANASAGLGTSASGSALGPDGLPVDPSDYPPSSPGTPVPGATGTDSTGALHLTVYPPLTPPT